jgi:hypothetical protein
MARKHCLVSTKTLSSFAIVAKGDGLEASFQDGRQFLRSQPATCNNTKPYPHPTSNPNPNTNPNTNANSYFNFVTIL